MAPPDYRERRIRLRMLPAGLSVGVHVGLVLLIALSQGDYEGVDAGASLTSQLLLIEAPKSERIDPRDSAAAPTAAVAEIAPEHAIAEAALPAELPGEPLLAEEPAPDSPEIVVPDTALAQVASEIPDPAATFRMAAAERSSIESHLTRLAEQFTEHSPSRFEWEHNGKRYTAALAALPAANGVEFDRVIAEVSADDAGKAFTTVVQLKRLAFSHYTQLVDRWDPMVQLHADEIVGRFHVNSHFKLLYDGRTSPRFLGKVTTAASSFSTQAAGRRRVADIFRGGIETDVDRIVLPEQLQPSSWAPADDSVRVHEIENDSDILFFADGSYRWSDRFAKTSQYSNDPSEQPVYFIARSGVALYVQGTVRGKVLVYSPYRVSVTGNLMYARDPRTNRESPDCLGLVSGRDIEIANSAITGPGDLMIQAALFAGRRFIVRDLDTPRTATLHIYGSLAAGTLSASEPRYATRIEYDPRLEQQRPPGFPSTTKFAADEWDGQWIEANTQTVSAAP